MNPLPSASPDGSAATTPLPCVLVMPAYNEEACIAGVVRAWIDAFTREFGDRFRVIVVDDGSRDRTGAVLDELSAQEPRLRAIHQSNAGHGGALRRGYAEALALGAERVFQVDSDDQFSPADFRALWTRREESVCILGHRVVRHDAFHRLVITQFLQWVLAGLYGHRIKDANIPFRLMHAGFLSRALGLIPADAFAPNIFLAVVAAESGADLMHLPVRHEDRKTGKVSLMRWRLVGVCLRCVRELWAFRGTLRQSRRARADVALSR